MIISIFGRRRCERARPGAIEAHSRQCHLLGVVCTATLVARGREVAPTDRADPASSPARRAGWGEEPPRRWPRQRLVVILSLRERLEVDGRIMRGVCPSRRNVRLTKGALKQASSPPMLGGSLASSASSAKRLNFLRRTTLPRGLKPTIRRHPCRCRCRELRVFFGPRGSRCVPPVDT